MAKHSFNISKGQRKEDQTDSNLGLTEAFAPVSAGDAGGARPADGDDSIGLTTAFAPLEPTRGAHAAGISYDADTTDDYGDALDSLEPRDEPVFADELPLQANEPAQGKHGRKSKAEKKELPPYMKKSRRVRRILIVVVILLLALIAAGGYFSYKLIGETQKNVVQQTRDQQQTHDVGSLSNGSSVSDSSTTVEKKTEVPNLVNILGKTQDEAVAALGHGAKVTSSKDVNEEGNSVKKNVNVMLTAEPADSRSGTPTVYLGLNEEGKIIQAGYSAATSSLGYGSISFSDAVTNQHIVEKTLREAGVNATDGAAVLPSDKMQYTTYASDGTTRTKENCSFSGTADAGGATRNWSSVLLYDYSAANQSGNLADTIRIIYIYVNA